MPRHSSAEYLPGDPEWRRITSMSGLDQLEAYAARLNNNAWVRNSGRLYFIAKRERADGSIEHFIDRSN